MLAPFTMARMSSPFRADQVGSLLRPASLLQARDAFRQGQLSREALTAAEDEAILRALDGQRRVGLPILSDGELRRGSWATDMADAVDGFVPHRRVLEWHGPGGGQEESTTNVVGAKLRPRQRLTGQQTAFLTQHAGGPFKMTVPAPSNFLIVGWRPGVTDAVYGSRADMMVDIVRIIRDEIEALIADGVRYIQLDAPFYEIIIDDQQRQSLDKPDEVLRDMVAADRAAIDGLARPGPTLALHVCRGNSRSRWLAEGGYEPIAEQLFGSLGADALLLEYDSPRQGSFEPLRFVRDATVVLGLVTTKEARMESVDELKRRIDEAARYVPLERLALSPQCGFASVAAGNLISEDDQWRKLELVVETARQVWA
jgi:5-methyltetrahydropteroyltriglutamate--homocysteine methyltransferase